MQQLAPASIAACRPSANGNMASEAIALPLRSRPASPAFQTAIFAASTRLIWPAPMPSVRSPTANTMALDLTCLTTRQAKRIARISASVGGRLVTTFSSRLSRPIAVWSRSITITPPGAERITRARLAVV